jgi:hypothetical protein
MSWCGDEELAAITVTVGVRATELAARQPAETPAARGDGQLPQAGMQISAHQGQQMALLAPAIGAKRAVEVGTFTGYSALCVAEALPADGKLWCCDVSDEWTRIGRRYWKEAGVADKIELTIGPALKTLGRPAGAGPRRPARHGLHRCQQERLRRLLRALPDPASARRPDPDRQSSCGAARWSTAGDKTTDTGQSARSMPSCSGDPRVELTLFASGTA